MGKKEILRKGKEAAVGLIRVGHKNPEEVELLKQIAFVLLLPEIEIAAAALAVVRKRLGKKEKTTKM